LSQQDEGATNEGTGDKATPGGAAQPDPNDFQAALRDATAAKAGDATKNQPVQAGATNGDAKADGTKTDAGKTGEGDDKGSSTADTAGKKDDKSASADTAAGKTAAKSPKNADIQVDWSKVRPALKAAYDAGTPEVKEAIEAEIKGRLRAGQQVSQLKSTLHQTKRKGPPASTSGRPPRKAADLKAHLNGAAMQALEKEAPEVTAAVKEALGPVISEIENASREQYIADQQADADFQESVLKEAHPDWEEVTSSEDFGKWLKGAPKHIQEAVARNAAASDLFPNGRIVDGEQAATVLTLFKVSMDTDSAGTEPPAADENAEGSQKPSPVETKRNLQRAGARQPDVRGVPAQSGVAEDDFEGSLREATRLKALARAKATA